ncbi:MAG: NAD(P)H-hydrate dehydratase, partial [Thermodesulfobacteriota bacterium]
TGKVMGVAIKARVTVTLGLPKLGLVIHPGLAYVGELEVHDIGIPSFVIREADIKADLIDEEVIRKYFPVRGDDTHKGDYGRLGIDAGSPGMTGAASLAGLGALRSGAGIITLAVPRGLNPIMEVKLTEVMTYPLEDTQEGWLAASAFKDIEKLWSRFSALVVGPGILPNADTLELMANIIERSPAPLAVDAGGLDAIAAQPELVRQARAPLVLTPHPGEMARILKSTPEHIQQDRVGVARDYAERNGVTLVLKGSQTVVAAASGRIYINPSGNPGMASGGMGDVLVGMIGGFLAQGLGPEAAALAAVHLHGLAGDKAAQKRGQRALAASDLLDELPGMINELEDKAAQRQSS